MDLSFDMYIRPDAFILIPVLYFIGVFLRQTPRIPEWSYVWIQLTFAIVACSLYYAWEIQSVVQGILVTGAAVISRDIIQNTIGGANWLQKSPEKDKVNKDE
ncbi:phage holin family protein [Ornithinibacillus halotolerans]|uniref:Holin n=1 Tax=Ornithinibacillus halotolerans TaxID=1274357 RepID=A0A916RXC0_9BACI|nr:phage holin family protein [Ornithinibacillus halotolerans]GGA71374.1 hypothetical protein GCM10008025_14090 [Ornithinibacillus halotolerans]